MVVKVNVTPEDIAAGQPSCTACPIALAVKQATGAKHVDAGLTLIAWRNSLDEEWTTAATPQMARLFMHVFDNEDVAALPFSFELEPREESAT